LLVRLCGILHVIEYSYSICQQLPDCGNNVLTDRFIKKFDELKQSGFDGLSVITGDVFNSAKICLDYLNKQRLVLSGYVFDINNELDVEVNNYLERLVKANLMKDDMSSNSLLYKILLYEGNIINITCVHQTYRCGSETVRESFIKLANLGLGSIKMEGKTKKNSTLS
jgi:hypothetical protein